MATRKHIILLIAVMAIISSLKGQTNSFRYRLDSIVTANYQQQNCYYHFARLYQMVTNDIDSLKRKGKFRDTAFIEEIEKTFGRYYLSSYDSASENKNTVYCWKRVYDTSKHTNRYVTSLILSMNAHINYDLFFALTEIFKHHPPTKANKKDYKLVAKVHDKIIADYIENALPVLKANKKWKRQTIRKLSKQAAKGLRIERNRLWNEANKAATNKKLYDKYSQRHKQLSQKIADKIVYPSELVKKGLDIATVLDSISFEKKVYLLNNRRP